jgi:hypothetical protein
MASCFRVFDDFLLSIDIRTERSLKSRARKKFGDSQVSQSYTPMRPYSSKNIVSPTQ